MEETHEEINRLTRRRGDVATQNEDLFPVSPFPRVSVSRDHETMGIKGDFE